MFTVSTSKEISEKWRTKRIHTYSFFNSEENVIHSSEMLMHHTALKSSTIYVCLYDVGMYKLGYNKLNMFYIYTFEKMNPRFLSEFSNLIHMNYAHRCNFSTFCEYLVLKPPVTIHPEFSSMRTCGCPQDVPNDVIQVSISQLTFL